MNRVTLERLDLKPGERVLEVGFGGGDLLASILAAPVAATGIDRSEAMVARARRRFRREIAAGKLGLLAGSAESLQVPSQSFDKACSVNALYFWPEPQAVLAELARVLRPDGCLVLAFQTPEGVRQWPGHVHGFHAYGVGEVSRLMEEAGFARPDVTLGRTRNLGEFACLTSWKI